MQVLDKSFDVLMEEFGIIKRVYCDVLFYTMTMIDLRLDNYALCINRDYLLSNSSMKRREKRKCHILHWSG